MTHEELVKKLKDEAAESDLFDEKEEEWISMIIDALEKQIPKKPIIRETEDYFGYVKGVICPNCKEVDFKFEQPCFCKNCGQAIDWSVNE